MTFSIVFQAFFNSEHRKHVGWNGLIVTEYDTIVSNYVALPSISLRIHFYPVKYISSYEPLFYCRLYTTTVQVLATSRLRMFHSRQKNYRKLALRKSPVQVQLYFPLMSPVARKLNMPQTKKTKHSQTAIQSLKRLTILQYNLSLKLTQNCYCNDLSPALPYQRLLLAQTCLQICEIWNDQKLTG